MKRIGMLVIAALLSVSAMVSTTNAAVVSIAVGDQPYYVHGPYYYVGPHRYIWVPGHWGWRHHHRAWVHGFYVVR